MKEQTCAQLKVGRIGFVPLLCLVTEEKMCSSGQQDKNRPTAKQNPPSRGNTRECRMRGREVKALTVGVNGTRKQTLQLDC